MFGDLGPQTERPYSVRDVPGGRRFTGDAFDVLPDLEPASYDMLLTDPPYATPARYYPVGNAKTRRRWSDLLILMRWFGAALAAVDPLLREASVGIVFAGPTSSGAFMPAMYETFVSLDHLVWDKQAIGPGFVRRQHELMLIGWRPGAYRRDGSVATVFSEPRITPTRRRHPAEKPVRLLAELIDRFCPPGGRVLDPFCGSGSAIDAALAVGRTCDGIEFDPWDDLADRNLRAGDLPGLFDEAEPLAG